jgi:membrane protein
MQLRRWKKALQQLKTALQLLTENDPLRLAGATAFFTTFALPFIVIILVQVLSLIFNRRAVSQQLFTQMAAVLGVDGTQQLIITVKGFRGLVSSWWAVAGGSVFMVFVATTLFRVIKNSFNQIWMIRHKQKQTFGMAMAARFKSLLLILFTGFLLVAGITLETFKTLFGEYLDNFIPGSGFLVNGVLSFLFSISITTTWFAMLLHFIPDGRPAWRVTFTGATLTALLFAAGKYVLKRLLLDSNIGQIFGPSGSFVLILLFVFYVSMILYYGAAFTKVWAGFVQQPITPLPHAAIYHYAEVVEDQDASPLSQSKP